MQPFDAQRKPLGDDSGDGGSAVPPGAAGPGDGAQGNQDDVLLLAALLDGMDAGLVAFDRGGIVTHWNAEAARILGWSEQEALGRSGFDGWAARPADAAEAYAELCGTMRSRRPGIHEFALLTKDRRRVLVRAQSAAVRDRTGRAVGVYCAFSEVRKKVDLERALALSEALFADAAWGVVLTDAELRPAVVNDAAARMLGAAREELLGRPLGDLLGKGAQELVAALRHVLAEGAPRSTTDLWLGLGGDTAAERRCLRSGFVRLGSSLGAESEPLGVGWLFIDLTQQKAAEKDTAQVRFRYQQLHRADRAAAECEEALEAVGLHLDFALAGFADRALLDLSDGRQRLVRLVTTTGEPGPCEVSAGEADGGIPVGYPASHPAVQALERTGTVRTTIGSGRAGAYAAAVQVDAWAAARRWPPGMAHGLVTVLRSRGRTVGALTFLRGAGRRDFDRADAAYAEDVAARVAMALDLAGLPRGR